MTQGQKTLGFPTLYLISHYALCRPAFSDLCCFQDVFPKSPTLYSALSLFTSCFLCPPKDQSFPLFLCHILGGTAGAYANQ